MAAASCSWAYRVDDLVGTPASRERPTQHLLQGRALKLGRICGQEVSQCLGLATQISGDGLQLPFADPVQDLALELERTRRVDYRTGHQQAMSLIPGRDRARP